MSASLKSSGGKWILLATILASGLGFLTGSAVNIALPTLQRVLGTDVAGVQWIANSYLLALSALILASGSLSDVVGVRNVFAAGIAVFTIGAGLSGAANGLTGMIIFRAVQGVGGALMVPSSLAVINTVFPREERGRAIGLWAGISGAIAALGPFFGGFLVDLNWRFVFLAFVPLGLLTFVVTLWRVPVISEREGSFRLDWPGTLLVVFGLGGLSFGLIRLPGAGFSLPVIIGLAGGVACGVGFVFRERHAEAPLVPPGVFKRSVTGANVATLFLYFALQGSMFLMSFRFQQLDGMRPIIAGVALLPTTIIIATLSGPSGSITDRRGPRLQMIAGPLTVAAGFGVLTAAGRGASYLPLPAVGLFLTGLGMAVVIPAVTSAAIDVRPERSGTASGVNNAVARVAGLIAIVVVGGVLRAVFANHLAGALGNLSLSAAARDAILSRSGELMAMKLPELPSDMVNAVRGALALSFAAGYRAAMLVNVLLATAASLVSVFTIGRSEN